MNGTDAAHYLIVLLPYAAFIRTLIFVILSIILYLERSNTILGRWISFLFLATTAANASTTWFVWYVTRGIPRDIALDTHQWAILMAMVFFPLVTGACGILVTYYTVKEEGLHDKRDIRQNERDVSQNVRDGFLHDREESWNDSGGGK